MNLKRGGGGLKIPELEFIGSMGENKKGINLPILNKKANDLKIRVKG